MKESIKIYRGYAREKEIRIFGHLFKDGIQSQYLWNKRRLKHALSVWRMFTLKTLPNVKISLQFEENSFYAISREDGYFEFTLPCDKLNTGWHSREVVLSYENVIEKARIEFVKPDPENYALVSDIDDTFLISHSSHLFRKLYVILTQNVSKRKFFQDVLKHYKLLANTGREDQNELRAFFYVSSSEWNLYNFIRRFTELHDFPKAVMKLKRIKSGLLDFFNTGGGDHDHKYLKIKNILEFYPDVRFVLLGDDSQKDPYIYKKISDQYPDHIKAIYIRQTGNKPKPEVGKLLAKIQETQIPICYYKLSEKAIQHSRRIELIKL